MGLNEKEIEVLEKLMIASGEKGNLPNAAIIVDGEGNILGESESLVATNKDATSHAERLVIEKVCRSKKSPTISGLKLVSAFEPCLMCLSAAYWAGITKVYYIIPAVKYWNDIPWVTEGKDIDKNELLKKFSPAIELEHLADYEKDFSVIFEKHLDKLINRNN